MASQASLITSNHQQGQSPLLALPGELRNKIYSYVFDSDLEIGTGERRSSFIAKSFAPCLMCECCTKPDPEPTLSPTSSGAPWYGLILSCRTLYSETYPLIFSMSPEISFSDSRVMENFCSRIFEPHLEMVSSIRLRLSSSFLGNLNARYRVREKDLVFKEMFPNVKVAKLTTVWLEQPDILYLPGCESYFWHEWLGGSGENGVTVEIHAVFLPRV